MSALLLLGLLLTPCLDITHAVTPTGPFVKMPGETVIGVAIGPGPAAAAQRRLDAAREAHPDAVLWVTASGRIEVSDSALDIGSNTIVSFADGAEVVAAGPDVGVLMTIDNATFVTIRSTGIEPVTFNGGDVGIQVTNSERVHLDRLAIRQSGTGIVMDGRDAARYAQGFSVTRTRIRECRIGMTVSNTAQFQCYDNITATEKMALVIDSADAMIVNNDLRGGVECRAALNAVVRNRITGRLICTPGSGRGYVCENDLVGGLAVDGQWHAFYRNRIGATVTVAGEDHTFCQNTGTAIPEADGAFIFNPPTQIGWHEDPAVPGLKRHDLTVQGTEVWTFPRWEAMPADERPALTPLSSAVRAVEAAVDAHPDAVIVVRLKGLFEAQSEWRIPKNVCIVLDGAIRATGPALDYRVADDPRNTQLIRLPSQGVASFSGGVVDAAFLPYHAMNMPGSARIVLDGVTVKRAGFNGVTTKEHNNARRPVFIRGCTVVDCANRGIWVHVCKNIHVLDCVSSGNISDGIDYDAYGHETTGFFNVCSGNRRHGIFIEEAVKHVRVFGNRLTGNGACGVAIWDEAVVGNTGNNSVVANVCRGNGSGVSIGGRSAEKTSNDNLILGNTIVGNRNIGLRCANAHSYRNYCAHNRIAGNARDVVNHSKRQITDVWTGGAPTTE